MPKYTSPWWQNAQQEFNFINENDLEIFLNRCKNDIERLVVILLYYTGARPSELCLLKYKNISLDDEGLLRIRIQTTKKGEDRTLLFELNKYTSFVFEKSKQHDKEEFVLGGLKRWNVRDIVYRISDKIINNQGKQKAEFCPYFFRHNRMSKLALSGANIYQIKYFKGAKTIKSVESYIHLSASDIKNLVKKIK